MTVVLLALVIFEVEDPYDVGVVKVGSAWKLDIFSKNSKQKLGYDKGKEWDCVGEDMGEKVSLSLISS